MIFTKMLTEAVSRESSLLADVGGGEKLHFHLYCVVLLGCFYSVHIEFYNLQK